MPRCFVIQPFDGGRFDKRFRDIFEPAILKAGFEPYRVDRDPSASIPIEEVARQIEESDLVFAEITLDNPNVCFELGYAIACRKEICLVCSKERTSKYPFDVHHRLIISYDVESPSDFNALSEKIKNRLTALKDKATTLGRVANLQVPARTEGLTHHEIACICALMQNREDPDTNVANWQVVKDMEKMGFTKLATQLALEKLLRKDFIESEIEEGFDRMAEEPYRITVYRLTSIGVDWMLDNEEMLELRP